MRVYVCMCVCMFVCPFVCTYVCMFVCVYVCITYNYVMSSRRSERNVLCNKCCIEVNRLKFIYATGWEKSYLLSRTNDGQFGYYIFVQLLYVFFSL